MDGGNCKIPNLDAFNSDTNPIFKSVSYVPCRNYELLTYMKAVGDQIIVHVNQTAVKLNNLPSVSCCYSTVTRRLLKDSPDDYVE